MCHHNGRQPPIFTLGKAIYGAYQNRKAKRAEASAQEIGMMGGKYATVPQQSMADAMDGHALHEKGVPPPDYDDVINNARVAPARDLSKDDKTGMKDEYDDDSFFLAADGEETKEAREELEGVKMSFFERLAARKEAKRMGREERREAWKAERRVWMERRAERRAAWRANRRGCCGRAF